MATVSMQLAAFRAANATESALVNHGQAVGVIDVAAVMVRMIAAELLGIPIFGANELPPLFLGNGPTGTPTVILQGATAGPGTVVVDGVVQGLGVMDAAADGPESVLHENEDSHDGEDTLGTEVEGSKNMITQPPTVTSSVSDAGYMRTRTTGTTLTL
ncbi:hypothetical protein F4808DRAFT_468540 [Astrocystis sublimbata]|nr:hypothetical protein F4808DRAFT_468540 [Astrocystis sublimbata]